jgi:replicative DNA helicase
MEEDRQVPFAEHQERTIIGACLVDEQALNDAIEFVEVDDFYLDSHRKVFRVILDISETGNPVDLSLVAEELTRRKELKAIGGVPYLASLSEGLPRKLNVESYCRIVKQKSVLRGLLSVCQIGTTRAYDDAENPQAILEDLEQHILDLSEGQKSKGFESILDSVKEAGGIESYISKTFDPQALTGLSMGFTDVDRMTGGMQPKELTILAARPSMGKAQPMDANVLTPRGFLRMSEVRVGTRITGRDGGEYKVTGVFPQGRMDVYRVHLSDGTWTECTYDHLWWTQTRNERRRGLSGSVKTLRQIDQTMNRPDGGRRNHALPLVEPVRYKPSMPLKIAPYTMGVLLGDGCLSSRCSPVISNPEPDIYRRVQEELPASDRLSMSKDEITVRLSNRDADGANTTTRALRHYGLMGAVSDTKFIPEPYLRATIVERRRLLAGLLDTDGHVCETGKMMEYTTASELMANQVAELVRGLGGRCSMADRIPTYTYRGETRRGKRSYRLHISFGNSNPSFSEKHAARWESIKGGRLEHRSIVKVEQVGTRECQCISVDAPDSLYVTDNFIVTHNTAGALCVAINVVLEDWERVVAFFSAEMSKELLYKRMLATVAEVNVQRSMEGFLSREEERKLAGAVSRIADRKLMIDDTASISVTQMRAKARRLKQKEGRLDLIVVDYLQLLTGSKKYNNREQEVSSISRGLKALAKELGVPVLALAQVGRGAEQRSGANKRPMLSDLRESGSIEADSDVVIFIHRAEYYAAPDDEDVERGVAEWIVSKNRNGATGVRKLAYNANITKFMNLEVHHD